MDCIHTLSPLLPPPDRKEILRYAGAFSVSGDLSALLEEVIAEGLPLLHCRLCWQEFSVTMNDNCVVFPFASVRSRDLKNHLDGCGRAVLFAATVGLALDRRIARYGAAAPAKALLLQAMGAERVEALCDCFCRQLEERCGPVTGRFSPGYGDLPLSFQRQLMDVLDCSRQLGLTLNDSLIMSPSKSVTGIIGAGSHCHRTKHSCAQCPNINCIHRRTP